MLLIGTKFLTFTMSITLPQALSELYTAKLSENSYRAGGGDFLSFLQQIQNGIRRKTLDLSRLQFGAAVLSRVPRLFRYIPDVIELNFYGNLIRDIEIAKVAQILLANPQLEYLDIGCNDLSDSALGTFIDIIQQSNLVSLQMGSTDPNFQSNRFTRYGLSVMFDEIIRRNRLKALGLAGLGAIKQRKNQRWKEYSQHLAELVMKCTQLKVLDISHNELCDSDQAALANGFSMNNSLERLDMHGNFFPTSFRVIEGITQIQKLIYLNLSNCSLNGAAVEILCDEFHNGWGLIVLDISGNDQLGSEAMIDLLDVLADNIYLTSLNISETGCDDSIAPELRTFLSKNEICQNLNISKNNLGDCLCDDLENASLVTLNISSCRITGDGAVRICQSLVNNKYLRHLYMRDNFLTKKTGYDIVEILQKNHVITKLDLTSNQIDIFAMDGVKTLCLRNKTRKHNEKLHFMRKEYIHLSIQSSKIPVVLERLEKYRKEKSVIEDEISALNEKIDAVDTQTAVTITSGKKAILEIKGMMETERKQIEEMKEKQAEMEEQVKQNLASLAERTAAEKKAFQVQEQEASKMEKETAEYLKYCDDENKRLTEEIAKVEALLEDVQMHAHNRRKLMEYEIPEYPYAEEEARIAAEREEELRRQREETERIQRELYGELEDEEKKSKKKKKRKSTSHKKSRNLKSRRSSRIRPNSPTTPTE